jgi:hypothetical protein
MKQSIGNACGTIAVLHSIGNNTSVLKIGGCASRRMMQHDLKA